MGDLNVGQTANVETQQPLTPDRTMQIFRLLAAPYSLQILSATHTKPMSAQQLAAKHGIPVAVAYRRVNELTAHGLLAVVGRPTNEAHRRVYVYQSTMAVVKLTYAPEQGVSLIITPRVPSLESLLGKPNSTPVSPSSAGLPGTQ